MKDKTANKGNVWFDLCYIALWYGITIAFVYLAGNYFGCVKEQRIIREFLALIIISVLLIYQRSIPIKELSKKRIQATYLRMLLFYIVLSVLTFHLAQVPAYFRPMFVIGVSFSILFDFNFGILMQMYLSMMLVLFQSDSTQIVLLYLASAILSCVIAKYLIEKELVMYIFLLLFAVNTALSGVFLYLMQGSFEMDEFKRAMLYNFVGILFVLLTLLYNNYRIVHGLRLKLVHLSQKDSKYLLLLKKESPFLYEHCIRVGDISAIVAEELGIDADLARTAGYYIKIGRVKKTSEYAKESLAIAKKAHFPEEVIDIMNQYNEKTNQPTSVEAAIVLLTDSILATITYLHRKHSDTSYENEFVVEQVLKNRVEGNYFDTCGMTLGMYQIVRKCLLQEIKEDKNQDDLRLQS